jgi:hypothetical protein
MGATQARVGLFSLGMWLLASLVVVDAVWAEGEVSFIAAPEVGVGRNPLSIAMGDFNGDGEPDLATANIGDGAASILLGWGDGTFQVAPDVGVGASPQSITGADFNGDGLADLATANARADTVSILLGQGDGTFQAAQDFDVRAGASAASITVGDFNGDGRPDMAIANSFANTVSVLINNSPGVEVNELVTFEPIGPTLAFTPDPTGCPAGFMGVFRFEARLTNISLRHV